MERQESPYLWRALGGGVLLGGAAGFALNFLLPYFLPEGSSALWLLVFLPTFLAAAATHEFGHLAAARLEGLILVYWTAGPLLLRRKNGRLRLSWAEDLLFAGSITAMAPAELKNVKEKLMTWVAGGPVATFLLTAISAMAWIWTRDLGWTWASWCAFACTVAGVVVFCATTLPWEASGFASDGGRLVYLARSHPAADRWCALAALAGMAHLGPRPSEWDSRVLERAIQPQDGSPDEVRGRLFNYYAALDSDDLALASIHLLRLSQTYSSLPAPLQAEYWLEQAYYSGFACRDAGLAAAALKNAGKAPLASRVRVARAQAAALLAAGEESESMRVASEALQRSGMTKLAGLAEAERSWLRRLADPASAVWQPGIEYNHAVD